MADPVTYPWVNFLMSPTKDIGSTPQQVFGSQYACMLDSLRASNTGDTELYLTLKILTAGREAVEDLFFAKDLVISPANIAEVLKNALLYMQAGDLLNASSSYSNDRFDFSVSYRELKELEGEITPTTYPWVNFLMTPTKDVDSTPLQVFGSEKTCILDSIWLCNTVDTEDYVTLKILTAGRETVEEISPFKECVISPGIPTELLEGSSQIMQPGDLLFANSSYTGDRFDCFVSHRQLNELEGA